MILYINMYFQLHNHDLLIRRAVLTDILSIMEIESASFGNHHWSYNTFVKELKNNYSNIYVSELITDNFNKKIVGYTGYWHLIDEGHIITLAVSHFYRRKHIADILLYKIIKNAYKLNIKWLTLEVRVSNIPAISLYNKYNFRRLGIRKNYYQDNNEDGLILWTENIRNIGFKLIVENNFNSMFKLNRDTDKYEYVYRV